LDEDLGDVLHPLLPQAAGFKWSYRGDPDPALLACTPGFFLCTTWQFSIEIMDHEDLGAGVRRREKKKRYLLGTNVSLCLKVLRVNSL